MIVRIAFRPRRHTRGKLITVRPGASRLKRRPRPGVSGRRLLPTHCLSAGRRLLNKRGTCEQGIKEGKGAIKWTRLSFRTFVANAVRLQLHALAYNVGNFLRTLAAPEPIKDWSLSSLKEKLIKIGAKVISHGRNIAFQIAEVRHSPAYVPGDLRLIAEVRPRPPPATA